MAKFQITFKDPDRTVQRDEPLTLSEQKLASMFFEYDEYVTLEFDTVTKTARVVPVSEIGG